MVVQKEDIGVVQIGESISAHPEGPFYMVLRREDRRCFVQGPDGTEMELVPGERSSNQIYRTLDGQYCAPIKNYNKGRKRKQWLE